MTKAARQRLPQLIPSPPKIVIEPTDGTSATLRDLTERSLTPEAGWERLAGVKVDAVLRPTNVVPAPASLSELPAWYPHGGVAPSVVQIVLRAWPA